MPLIPDIPERFSTFPDGYVNDINGWGFDEATIKSEAGKLLTLDIDFGARCSLNCPFCFRRNNSVDINRHELQPSDLVRVVQEAKELGLRSIKFLGAGEPLENSGILEFLHFLRDLEVTPVLFTKSGVIGNDDAVSSLFGRHGIHTGKKLCKELYECNVSVVVGFNAFSYDIQRRMVGDGPDYVEKRNRVLELLAETGFSDPNPTRLALGVNPVLKMNYAEAFKVYKWARLRNMYAIVTPTMISGRAKGNAWKAITPSVEELITLYTKIYQFNLDTHLMNYNQLTREGIASYAGGHPCNQVAAGLYVTLNGVVLSCPGSEELIEGNVWTSSLKDIWLRSSNYRRKGTFNCRCIAKDGKSIPLDLYSSVLQNIQSSTHSAVR